ncbi:MAG: hypothetical protein KIT69_01510 [Propionibacteriaceae bacterium]|nr:hypothetical protein [Propionibacteriaceae bacterium]
MTITQSPPGSLARLGETTCLAVSYLRVSTKEQASKGGRDEGFSIPAQREANLRKARELNAIITEEFVDAWSPPVGVEPARTDPTDRVRQDPRRRLPHRVRCRPTRLQSC